MNSGSGRSFNSISNIHQRNSNRTTVPLVIFFLIVTGLMIYHVSFDSPSTTTESSSSTTSTGTTRIRRKNPGLLHWIMHPPKVAPLTVDELVRLDLEKQKILRNEQLVESGAGTTAPLPPISPTTAKVIAAATTTTSATAATTAAAKPKPLASVGTDPLGGSDGLVIAKTTTTTSVKKEESTEVNLSHIPTSSSSSSASASASSAAANANTMDHDRLHLYCNEQILPGVEGPNKFHGYEHYVLKDLIVTIRHGDRSGIHVMPGSERVAHDSNYHTYDHDHHLIDPQALRYSNKLGALKIVKLPTKEKEAHSGEDVSNALNPAVAFHRSDYNLSQGQLTSRGFMQHVHLGQILSGSYKTFLDQIKSPDEIYVRSTNYVRTLQSVGGLLTTTLPKLMANNKVKIPINMYENELDEVMHGIGLRASSHSVNDAGQGETEFHGKCDAAVKYAKKQKASYVRKSPIFDRLARVFGKVIHTTSTTELVDSAMPSYCHSLPLPCGKDQSAWIEKGSDANPKINDSESSEEEKRIGHKKDMKNGIDDKKSLAAIKANSNNHRNLQIAAVSATKHSNTKDRCLNPNHVYEMMIEGDRSYCERFSGNTGGLNSTKLSLYPFMKEILEHLKDSVAPIGNATHSANSTAHKGLGKKLSIFSGHDTVIAPVLSALGVYHDSLCYWPGYASRIVFELYAVTKTKQIKEIPATELQSKAKDYMTKLIKFKHEHRTFDDSFASDESAAVIQKRLQSDHYVRVVYNGIDVTTRIPGCLHERIALSQAIQKSKIAKIPDRDLELLRLDFPLCSLVAFEEQIQQMIAPFKSLKDACNAKVN